MGLTDLINLGFNKTPHKGGEFIPELRKTWEYTYIKRLDEPEKKLLPFPVNITNLNFKKKMQVGQSNNQKVIRVELSQTHIHHFTMSVVLTALKQDDFDKQKKYLKGIFQEDSVLEIVNPVLNSWDLNKLIILGMSFYKEKNNNIDADFDCMSYIKEPVNIEYSTPEASYIKGIDMIAEGIIAAALLAKMLI